MPARTSLEDCAGGTACLIGFSQEIWQEQQELKKFLRDNLYRHYKVARMSAKARHTIEVLFNAFCSDIRLLPRYFSRSISMISIRRLPIISPA